MKLAIVTTHPIQYYAPVFKILHKRGNLSLRVFYTWGEEAQSKYDPGFGSNVQWDVPLLEGYHYQWVPNIAAYPGSHHFKGIVNPELVSLIKVFNPDAILVIGWAYDSHLKAMRYFKGKIPLYFRGDSNLLDETRGVKALLRAGALRWIYKHVDHAFYVGTNNKHYYIKYGLQSNQLSFAPHAIDNARFGHDHDFAANQLRGSLGIKSTDLIVLFAGKFEAKKSPALLLDAFLNLQLSNTHLVFAGSGDLEEELKLKASNNSQVHFLGFKNQSQMPVIYQTCDLFCLPSAGPGETWGLAVNEAMACGKAVLVSDKVGCAIDLVSRENGATFRHNDLESLSLALNTLLTEKTALKEMGRNSEIKIAPWSFENVATAVEVKLLKQVKASDEQPA